MRRILLVACLAAGCVAGAEVRRPESALEARYRQRKARGRRVVATAIYRDLLAQSLFSRCKMVPTDSEMFDHRARRCGALTAAVLGISRLFLEASAAPRFLRPLRLDGRLRWMDLPGPDECSR